MGWREILRSLRKKDKNASKNVEKANDDEIGSSYVPKENKTFENPFSHRLSSPIDRHKLRQELKKKRYRMKTFVKTRRKAIINQIASSQTEINQLFRNCDIIVRSVFGSQPKVKIASAGHCGSRVSQRLDEKQLTQLICSKFKNSKNKAHTIDTLRKRKLKRIRPFSRPKSTSKSHDIHTGMKASIECSNRDRDRIERTKTIFHTVSRTTNDISDDDGLSKITENIFENDEPSLANFISVLSIDTESSSDNGRLSSELTENETEKNLFHRALSILKRTLKRTEEIEKRPSSHSGRQARKEDDPEVDDQLAFRQDIQSCCSTGKDNARPRQRHFYGNNNFKINKYLRPVSMAAKFVIEEYDGISLDIPSVSQSVIAQVHASDIPYDSSISVTEQHINDVCTNTTSTVIEVARRNPLATITINPRHLHKWCKLQDLEIQFHFTEYLCDASYMENYPQCYSPIYSPTHFSSFPRINKRNLFFSCTEPEFD